jgi:miniconductance mechanosensitive channel
MKKEVAEDLFNKIERIQLYIGLPQNFVDRFGTIISGIIVLVTAFALTEIAYRTILFVLHRIVQHKEYAFLSKVLKRNRLRKQVYILPPAMINAVLPLIIDSSSVSFVYLEHCIWLWLVISITIAINATLGAVGESAFTNSRYHDRPIKGFIQISRIIVHIIAIIVIISILTNRSPLYLIGGLGAFAAVLMLIAKDSIMGFVGGFLLLENDMVRLGDWIEVPGTGINGNVFDISLTIVKVRNWDNTIATIPPYTLINDSFINWRGMSESGGRRIARGYMMKIDSIKPCNDIILQRLKKLDPELGKYITMKTEQQKQGIECNTANPQGLANGSIETNAGLFRAYAYLYLHRHPMIRKDMLIMVRTLEPTEAGLPIQFYCFTTDTDWSNYESIQSEIMEHFASVMPQFELYPYQSAGARDTIMNGLLEGQFPIEHIDGLPYKITK